MELPSGGTDQVDSIAVISTATNEVGANKLDLDDLSLTSDLLKSEIEETPVVPQPGAPPLSLQELPGQTSPPE